MDLASTATRTQPSVPTVHYGADGNLDNVHQEMVFRAISRWIFQRRQNDGQCAKPIFFPSGAHAPGWMAAILSRSLGIEFGVNSLVILPGKVEWGILVTKPERRPILLAIQRSFEIARQLIAAGAPAR